MISSRVRFLRLMTWSARFSLSHGARVRMRYGKTFSCPFGLGDRGTDCYDPPVIGVAGPFTGFLFAKDSDEAAEGDRGRPRSPPGRDRRVVRGRDHQQGPPRG